MSRSRGWRRARQRAARAPSAAQRSGVVEGWAPLYDRGVASAASALQDKMRGQAVIERIAAADVRSAVRVPAGTEADGHRHVRTPTCRPCAASGSMPRASWCSDMLPGPADRRLERHDVARTEGTVRLHAMNPPSSCRSRSSRSTRLRAPSWRWRASPTPAASRRPRRDRRAPQPGHDLETLEAASLAQHGEALEGFRVLDRETTVLAGIPRCGAGPPRDRRPRARLEQWRLTAADRLVTRR